MDNEKLKERGCTPLEDLISEDFGVPGTAERYEFENSCEAFIIGEQLRAERLKAGMTQEQLAEKFEVSARTVSRWETGTNLPDLSILVELAEYYDVEMRELLDGERSQTMNKEMKETLDKVAVYEEWVKQKALKAGNLAFASMFVISVLAIIIQMLLTVDIRLVLGETATALVGGILYSSIMVYNGIWDKCLPKSATIWRDFLTSVICAGIFTVIYGVCLFRMGATETQITRLALGFLTTSGKSTAKAATEDATIVRAATDEITFLRFLFIVSNPPFLILCL